MALSNYQELKASVVTWMQIPEVSNLVPDFIRLCEARLKRTTGLNLREYEVEDDLLGTVGSRYISLPTYYLEPIALWLTTYPPRRELRQCLPSELPVDTVSSGQPDYWAIDGNNIAFEYEFDIAYTFTFRYRKSFNLLSSSGSASIDNLATNWILTEYPDVYLFGTLVQGAKYVRDNEQMAIWEQNYKEAVAELKIKESRHQSNVMLKTDMSARRSNIYEGN